MRFAPYVVFDTTERPSSPQFVDLAGRTFGRLTVIGYAGRLNRRNYSRCECACGATPAVMTSNLTGGHTTSCGCAHTDATIAASTTHGHAGISTKTGEYRSWVQMKTRCLNPKYYEAHLYGGRGITVCRRWIESFEAFLVDMGPKPSPRHSIDRWPDVNGNYEPGNCRWASPKQQAENRRKPAR